MQGDYYAAQRPGRLVPYVFTLNRPEVLNAVDPQLHFEPENMFTDVSRDDDINAVVLTGAASCRRISRRPSSERRD